MLLFQWYHRQDLRKNHQNHRPYPQLYRRKERCLSFGNSGMQEGISANSTQSYLMYNLSKAYSANETVELYLQDELVFSGESLKSFNSIIMSFDGLNEGDSLSISIGNDTYEAAAGQSNGMNSFGGKGFRG